MFRTMPNEKCQRNSALLSLVGEITHCHWCLNYELRVAAAVELHLNAIYMLNQFIENQKSVYGKS